MLITYRTRSAAVVGAVSGEADPVSPTRAPLRPLPDRQVGAGVAPPALSGALGGDADAEQHGGQQEGQQGGLGVHGGGRAARVRSGAGRDADWL